MTEFTVVDRPVDPPPGAVAVLPEVLIAMRWWRGVAMRRAEPVAMTPLERFTLELALTTGRADPNEFFEITGLPGALLPIAARRLVTSRALTPADGGYLPQPQVAEHAARIQTVYEQRHASLDFILLPRTGDLLALDPRSSGLRAVEALRPRSAGNAPVSAGLVGTSLAAYLRTRLQDRTVAGIGDDIVEVGQLAAESPPMIPNGLCPVYRCQGELRAEGERYLPVITLPGNGNNEPVSLVLTGADGLARHWLALADTISDPAVLARAWAVVTGRNTHTAPRAQRTAPARWTCRLSAADASHLAGRGRNLALPVGIAIHEEDAVIEVTIDIAGADQAADALIDTDRMLTAAAAPGVDTSAVPRTRAAWQRAWQLGFPGLAYALREAEDFSYA
ncbi:hypothetical protein [Allorhizocola rhizosphaerae]|uniref:hypothetical protein n=1 Tax=Allorhizocola rhizosphaerae TaxID=1872709 RepID=UPI000E3EC220|nr:hypothetical protein [Allorhizocola rhizosphaerae]